LISRLPTFPNKDCLKEPWKVCKDTDQGDRNNIVGGLPRVRRPCQRVADAKKSLNRNGKGGENASSHASVGERVDHVGEQDCEHAAVRLKGSEGVVESSS